MDVSERDELRRLRREMELCSLGDRPQSIAASKLQRLIELEAREIHDYATKQLNGGTRYSIGDLSIAAMDFINENDASRDLSSPDAIKLRLFLGMFLTRLAKREQGKESEG